MHAMSALLIGNLEAVSKQQRMVCCFVQELIPQPFAVQHALHPDVSTCQADSCRAVA